MRNLLLILLLALAAGGLLVLVLDQEASLEPENDLTGGPGDEPAPEPAPAPKALKAVVEVVPEGKWHLEYDHDEAPALEGDPRLSGRRLLVSPDGKDWFPTGAQVIDVLNEAFPGKLRVKFHDDAALEDFKRGKWPIPIPGQYRPHMLLDTAVEIGFRPIVRADAIYMIRLEDAEDEGG